MKNSFLALSFSLIVMLPFVSHANSKPTESDTLTTANGGDPVLEEVFDIDMNEPFWFQEKVYIHIYDLKETPLIDGAFSRKDLKENKALKDLLRKSSRFLSIGSHHYYYYYVKEGQLN